MNVRFGSAFRAFATLSLAVAAPSSATEIHLGGIDVASFYTASTGVFSFDGGPTDDDGRVTSSDFCCFDFTPSPQVQARIEFEAVLGPLSQLGTPFVPAVDNVKKAIFEGQPGADLLIYDPIDDVTVLLAFDLDFIEVTNATKANASDGDGSILLGDATASAVSSSLTLVGGTLFDQFEPGTTARLLIFMQSLTPGIVTRNDFKGYLGSDFVSGIGAAPIHETVWELTIISMPEPGTLVLLGCGLLGLAFATRRRTARR